MNSDNCSQPSPDKDGEQQEGIRQVTCFTVFCRQHLLSDGTLAGGLPDGDYTPDFLKVLYRQMVLTRTFDHKAIALQRTGRLGTYASVLGQEAVGAGVASAMKSHDVLLPSFREHGAQLQRGVTIRELLLYWGGDERGSDFSGPRHDFSVCIPVGSQFPHAAGTALALRHSDSDGVAVVIAGDGATSKGDFYEALNIAGVWKLPMLVVIANNQWAISVPRASQTRASTLAQKAIAAGIPGEQVDGNDVIAVHAATSEALAAIRAGSGPRLIEALTYRLGDHTTVDDASRYREDEEVSRHWKEEPVARLRAYLTEHVGWSKDDEQALLGECETKVNLEAEAYLQTSPQPASSIFEYLYEALPSALDEQARAVAARQQRKNDGEG